MKVLKIYELDNDDSTIVEDGEPTTDMIWMRSDKHSMSARLNGTVYQIFDNLGRPAQSPLRATGTLTRATTDGTSVQSVTGLGFQAGIVYLYASDDADATTFSDGWSDGTIQVCTQYSVSVPTSDLANALNVQLVIIGSPAGWTATVASNADGFDLSWVKVNAGLNVTVKYLAIK